MVTFIYRKKLMYLWKKLNGLNGNFLYWKTMGLTSIIERLRGTPGGWRKYRGLRPGAVDRERNEKWSIKEEVGIFPDLEPLWLGRLEISSMDYRLRVTD